MEPSKFEKHTHVAGILLVVIGIAVAIAHDDSGGLAQVLGASGLGVLGLGAFSRGARLYRSNVPGSMPQSVGRVSVQARPARVSTVTAALLALVLPAAAAVALVASVRWGWLALAGAVLVGGLGMLVNRLDKGSAGPVDPDAPEPRSAQLERLCMRADIPVPQLVVEDVIEANAWTSRGRIHLTRPLLMLLDKSELEAVMAHELAHLAHRDAAVMDVCAAPSRMLLGYVGVVFSGLKVWVKNIFDIPFPGIALFTAFLAVLGLPAAFVFGWVSRLSVLGMSRAREFAADAAAVTLTGRPSALASALLKLDRDGALLPRGDLREVQVLCIVGSDSSRLGPLFNTHPQTAARVARLKEIEQRMQARSGARFIQ